MLCTWAGHAPAAPASQGATIDIQLEAPLVVEPLEPEPDPQTHADDHAAHWPQHTHPYPVPPDHDAVPHDPRLVHLPLRHDPARASPAPATVAQPAPAETANDDLPHFTLAVGSTGTDAHGAVSPSGTAAPRAEVAGPTDAGGVDVPAHLAQGVLPAYPEDARAAHIEADVGLELVVSAQGAVESVRVVRPAGHGFDAPAVDAARRFRFVPARTDGRPVAVRMAWTVQFRLW